MSVAKEHGEGGSAPVYQIPSQSGGHIAGESTSTHLSMVHERPRRKNPLLLFAQLMLATCGGFCLLVALGLVISAITFDAPEVNLNEYKQHSTIVNYHTTVKITDTIPFALELLPQTSTGSIYKLRMCFEDSGTVSGEAQVLVPFPQIPFDDVYHISPCPSSGVVVSNGVALCSQSPVYVNINGTESDTFTLRVYLDDCYEDDNCTCDYLPYALVYFSLLLISVFTLVVCWCCYCCCGLFCCGGVVLITMTDKSSSHSQYPPLL